MTPVPELSPLESAALRGLRARERLLAALAAEMRADFQALIAAVEQRTGAVHGRDFQFSDGAAAGASPPAAVPREGAGHGDRVAHD